MADVTILSIQMTLCQWLTKIHFWDQWKTSILNSTQI